MLMFEGFYKCLYSLCAILSEESTEVCMLSNISMVSYREGRSEVIFELLPESLRIMLAS